jgi:hypothetical protein
VEPRLERCLPRLSTISITGRQKADPDVWLQPAVKPDGFEYYELVLCYVDDVLCMSHDAMKTMKGIQRSFKLKDDKIEEPDTYLGAGLSKMTTANLLVHVV